MKRAEARTPRSADNENEGEAHASHEQSCKLATRTPASCEHPCQAHVGHKQGCNEHADRRAADAAGSPPSKVQMGTHAGESLVSMEKIAL
jgi:hypothetical protein